MKEGRYLTWVTFSTSSIAVLISAISLYTSITGVKQREHVDVPDVKNAVQTGKGAVQILCIGDRSGNCPIPFTKFLPCQTDVKVAAKDICAGQTPDISKISDISGNRCGYATFKISCP